MRLELLGQCEELIKSFNPKRMSLEAHVSEYLASRVARGGDASSGEADGVFLREVVYGVMQYKAALKVFMTCFFNEMMGRVVRSDYTLYTILTYLAVFRLRELSVAEYRRFALAVDPDKMVNFLEFVFDCDRLENAGVAAHWLRIFDADYVHDVLLKDLRTAAVEVRGLVAELKTKSNGPVENDEQPRRKPTVPHAPKLTAPAPRRLPEPRMISSKAAQPGATIALDRPSTPGDIGDEPAAVEQTTKVLRPKKVTKVVPMKLHETRDTKHDVAKAVEAEFQASLEFDRKFRVRAPARKPAPVRYTTSAILREDRLFQQRLDEESRRVEAATEACRNDFEFVEWQASMRRRDAQVRLDQVARTRLLAKASAEEAAQAKETRLRDNKALRERQAMESTAMNEQRKCEAEATLAKHQKQALEVREVRDVAPKRAVEEARKLRCEIRDAVKADLEERFAVKKAEETERLAALSEQATKLKVDFTQPKAATPFDPTSSSGLGLLDEMSMAEMRSRLKANHVKNAEMRDKKRGKIVAAHHAQRDKLVEKAQLILDLRDVAAAKAASAKAAAAAKKQADDAEKKRVEEAQLAALADALTAKRAAAAAQRKLLADEEARAAKRTLFAGESERLREQRTASDLLKAAERQARDQQRTAASDAAIYEATRHKAREQQRYNKSRAVQTQARVDNAREASVREARAHTRTVQKEEMAEKKLRYRDEVAAHRTRLAQWTRV